MITSVYAHILDKDHKINVQKFESVFYANPDLRSVRPPEEPKGAFVGSSIRKILLKCRFSKAAVFLSRRDENFPAYFADIQENIDGVFKRKEKCQSGDSK